MNYFLHHGINVKNVIDHMAKPITTEQYLDAVGNDNLIFEPVTLEEVEATYFYGLPAAPVEQSQFYDAIKTKKNRIDTTMGAFGKALNSQLNGSGIEAAQAVIGDPRKAGQFAIMSAQFPLSDGQGITIVFHSPTNDPSKITEQDDLIAFRFLLNKRDVTHVVAPSGGQDISLKQTTLSLANLAERNSARFQAKQADNKQKQDELKTIQDATSQLQAEADALTTQADDLNKQQQDASDAVSRTQALLDKQKSRNAALQSQLDGLKPPAPVVPEPTIKGDENKPAGVALIKQDNRPQVGYVFPESAGEGEVVKSTDRFLDIKFAGSLGIREKVMRYTWDGVGYKNKGIYIKKDGTYASASDLTDEEYLSNRLPTDSFTKIGRALEKSDMYRMDNQAVIYGVVYQGDTYIEIIDNNVDKVYRIKANSGLIEDAKKLYAAYKAGKASDYAVDAPLPKDQTARPKPKAPQQQDHSGLIVGDRGELYGDSFVVKKIGMGSAEVQLDGENVPRLLSVDDLNKNGLVIRGVNDLNYPALAAKLLPKVERTFNTNGTLDFDTQDRLILMMEDQYGTTEHNGMVWGAQQAILSENASILAAKAANDPAPVPEPTPPADDSAKTLYWYGLRARPLSIGAQPAGQVAYIEKDSVASDPRTAAIVSGMPSDTAWRWGAIAYDHQLTDKEVSNFELVPLLGTKWTPEYRAEKFAEFKEWMNSYLQNKSLTEFINEAIKPNASMINDSPFSSLGIYYPKQLTLAFQEAGYTGSIINMVNTLYDELTTTDEDRAYQAEQEAIRVAKENQQKTVDALKSFVSGAKLLSGWTQELAQESDWLDKQSDTIPEKAKYKQPFVNVTAPDINGEPFEFMLLPDIDDNGAPKDTFTVTYDEGSPVEGGKSLFAWEGVIAVMSSAYSKALEKESKPAPVVEPQPEPTPPATKTGNAVVTKALADLQDIFDNETNIDAYLMKMEAAFNEIDAAGATTENEPFMQKVADKLTALMAAEGVAA